MTSSGPALRPLRNETRPSQPKTQRQAPRRTGASPTSGFSESNGNTRGGAVQTTPLWNQADPRWGARTLGRNATIHNAGCAMSATAMAASQISGRSINPGELDQLLDTHGGYSGDSLNWDRAAQQYGLTTRAVSSTSTSGMNAINRELDNGRPVVVGVDYKPGTRGGANGTDHYITLTGRSRDANGNVVYHANDPAGGRQITLAESNGRLVETSAIPSSRRPQNHYTLSGPARIFVGGHNSTPGAGSQQTSGATPQQPAQTSQSNASTSQPTGTSSSTRASRARPDAAATTGGGERYTIQRGDTLSALAKRFGVSMHDLASANGIRDPNKIYAGNDLVIPGRSGQVSSSRAAPQEGVGRGNTSESSGDGASTASRAGRRARNSNGQQSSSTTETRQSRTSNASRTRNASGANGSLRRNQEEAYRAAIAEGLSPTAARALVANMTGESLRNPTDRHWDVSHYSQGIVQWSDDRARRIERQFGKQPKDMTVAEQTRAAIWELRNQYPRTWRALQGNDPHAMINSLVRDFERPANPEQQVQLRMGHYNSLGSLN